jgi:hypothetical protein
MSRPSRTSSTSPSSLTPLPGASSAGGCRAQHGRTSYSTRSSRRCVIAARSAKAAWCTTAIAACNTSRSATPSACSKLASSLRQRRRQLRQRARRNHQRPVQDRGNPPARPVAQCRDGGVRYPRMGRLVQQSSLARTDRKYPSGRSRSALLCPSRRARHGGVTQTK